MSLTTAERCDEWARAIDALTPGDRVFLLAWGGAMGPQFIQPKGVEELETAAALERKSVLEAIASSSGPRKARRWRLTERGVRLVIRLERMTGAPCDG